LRRQKITADQYTDCDVLTRSKELVAELGAAFLCADLDLTLEPREDHAAYIANWLDVLKADNRAIFTAASHAQRAADFINGLQPAASAG
jgi:antirestriction protein ArdC